MHSGVNSQPAATHIKLKTLAENAREFGALSELIGRIYECAIDPSQWDDTLAEVVGTLSPADWDVILLVWERLNPPGCRFVGATSLIPMAREIYRTMFAGRHPWSRRLWALPAGRVVHTDEIMPRSEILESEFYKKFLHTWNMEIALAVVLDRQANEKLALIMPGPPGASLDNLKRGLRLLAPHMQRAIRISRALGEANLRASAAQSAMEAAPNAVITLTPQLKVMSTNAKAHELVETGWAKIIDGGYVFTDRKAQQELTQLAEAHRRRVRRFARRGPTAATSRCWVRA